MLDDRFGKLHTTWYQGIGIRSWYHYLEGFFAEGRSFQVVVGELWYCLIVAARALATYLIPGCVGRGVRLGSESSSVSDSAGGVWKSKNLEIWEFGDLGTWKSRDLGSTNQKNA